jgi:endonuclease/exonuclease/phosphatase family metal-dependent hydrolase
VQEAYRHDPSVPDDADSRHHGGRLGRAQRCDIVELAARCGLSLRYSPSMRNGSHASDRGNAILATVRLADAHAFLLPYVRQRRVAVSARIAGQHALAFVSAHLDTHGRLRAGAPQWRFATGRVAQAKALARAIDDIPGSVLIGADLNTLLGVNDPALRALLGHGLRPARRIGSWRHTFHTPFRLLLDHVLYRSADGIIDRVEVVRIDEAHGDRSSSVFGSDHHPLLAHIELLAA